MIGSGHYALSGGNKLVSGAGTVIIRDEVVTGVTNWSGHYKPNADQKAAAVKQSTKAGVRLSKDFQQLIAK
jgi:hypothetical protein